MSETDRKLGHTEQALEQAIDALRDCRDALDGMLDRFAAVESLDTRLDASARSAKRMADVVLALHAKRRIGTECAAVAKDVLLAGVGVDRG